MPVLVAVETVIAHCTNKGRAMDGMPSRPARPRVYESKARFTPDDDQLLVDLKDNESLAWKEVISYFPGRTEGSLKKRYAKVKAMPFLEGRVAKMETTGIQCRQPESEERLLLNRSPVL